MKKIVCLLVMSVVLSLSSQSVFATATPPADSVRDASIALRITDRVREIEAMDKTMLTSKEKKNLRKELKQMHKEAAGLDSKVSISIGVIIIAILLLILILN